MRDLASPPVVSSRNFSRNARYVFSTMFAIYVINYLDRYILSGVMNVMGKELNIDLEKQGIISSAFLIVYTLTALPLGLLADRTKRKTVIASCVTIWSMITALTALIWDFGSLFVARMLLGIGEAGYFPAGNALMSDYFEQKKRARIMSWWGSAQVVGILGGLAIGGLIAGLGHGMWRLAFLVTGIPGLIVAFFAWRIREPRRNEADERATAIIQEEQSIYPEIATIPANENRAENIPFRMQLLSFLRNKSLVSVTLLQLFAFFVFSVSLAYLPTYLQQDDIFKMDSGLAGLYAGGIIVVAGAFGTIGGGYLADILNRWFPGARILVCGIGFLISAPLFAIAITSRNITIFTVFFILTAMFLTLHSGPSTAATQDVVPARQRASANAFALFTAHLLGDVPGPALVGFLAHSLDSTGGQHFLSNIAGNDISTALVWTCTPALICAGIIGIIGSRFMSADVARARASEQTQV